MAIDFNIIERRILDIYHQEWYSSINNSRRLETYAMFKHSFEFEKYLDCIQEKKYRIALSRFRISAHNLAIETGRYENIERNQRTCLSCNTGMPETEYHHLLVCTKYKDLRTKYFKRYYCSWPNIQKLTNLLSDKSNRSLNNLSKFIYFASKLRVQQ